MAQSLEQRLESASQSNRINLTDLAQLIADATTERNAQAALHVSQSADAVNFRLAQADRDDAAKGAERAARNAAMLDAAIVELEGKLQARKETDKRASAEAERNGALAERDALAERIKSEWPLIVDQMTALFDAIQSNDARMKAAGLYDSSAEAVARGCDGLFRYGVNQVRRMVEMQVPQLGSHELAWPRPVKSALSKFTESVGIQRKQQIASAAKAAAAPSPYIWHVAKVSNGVANRFFGQHRDDTKSTGQISNGETNIRITAQEAERLNAIEGITVTKLAKAPEAVTTFKYPGAA